MQTDEDIGYRELCAKIERSNSKVVIIYGISGCGKSALLQQLAFSQRKKMLTKRAVRLSDYDILYIKIGAAGYTTIDSIIEPFRHLTEGCSVNVYLDAFDELPTLLKNGQDTGSADVQFDTLMEQITQYIRFCHKIVLSTRLEVFENGEQSVLNHLVNNDFVDTCSVKPFTFAQSIRLYRKTDVKENRKTRKSNLKKLETIYDKAGSDSVFSFPFVIKWSGMILKDIPVEHPEKLSWYDIIEMIVTESLKREYHILLGMRAKKPAGLEEAFFSDARAFIRNVAEKMEEKEAVTAPDFVMQNEDGQSVRVNLALAARNLIRYIDQSFDENGAPARYTFLHRLMYYYTLADIISDMDCDPEKRYAMLEKHGVNLWALYFQALRSKYSDVIEIRDDAMDFRNRDCISVKFSYAGSEITRYFSLFPNICWMNINGIQLDADDTEAIIKNRKINFIGKQKETLRLLALFPEDWFSSVILSDGFCNAEDAADSCSKLKNLRELKLFGSGFDFAALCSRWSSDTHPELVMECWDIINIPDSPDGVPFSETEIKLYNPWDNRESYRTVWEARRRGIPIRITTMLPAYRETPLSDADVGLLEAVYEQNRMSLSLMQPEDSVVHSFLFLSYYYAKALISENRNEASDTVLDDILSLVIDRSKSIYEWAPHFKYLEKLRTETEWNPFIGILQMMSSKGNAKAQTWLGRCLYNGRFVKKDTKEGIRFLTEASENGDSDAQYFLGYCYYKGLGVEQRDYDEAVRLFRLSAEQGLSHGQLWLGYCYYEGHGVERRDYEEAVKWFRKSADQGNSDGQEWLGSCYYRGHGVERRDYEEAVKWFRKSADQGNSGGQKWLGYCYYEGHGVERRDYEEAVKWFRKSAEQEDSFGQHWLGHCYYEGHGVKHPDYEEAVKWLSLSAKQGNADAQKLLDEVLEKIRSRIPPSTDS